MEMEHFIETVRKYPCLWNTTAIEYRDQELKDAAWTEVMKETDLSSVKEVKLKWKKLRDSYRDALKRQNDMLAKDPHNATKKNYAWKYMGPMQFLQPHMNARKKAADPQPPAPAANGVSHSSDESESEPGSEPKRKRAPSPAARQPAYPCARSKRPADPPAPYERKRDAPGLPDPLDIFFNSMCQSTKRFPYPTQIKIKKALFNAVIEAEEGLIAEQQNYAMLWARGAGSSSSSEGEAGEGGEGGEGEGGDEEEEEMKPFVLL
ncbi:breakpoint cluster region protein-like [Colias croceus]|uniref:breakpoint cluster region protein-like n=1 Tax=Colias crocea TaxID=72248 RepID=UPI001E27A407|nr:breakpoint cluster region protein-like [Colias croceus]